MHRRRLLVTGFLVLVCAWTWFDLFTTLRLKDEVLLISAYRSSYLEEVRRKTEVWPLSLDAAPEAWKARWGDDYHSQRLIRLHNLSRPEISVRLARPDVFVAEVYFGWWMGGKHLLLVTLTSEGVRPGDRGPPGLDWDTELQPVFDRIGTLTRDELIQNGVTYDMAKAWRDFYRNDLNRNPANESAHGRIALMERAMDLLK